MEPSGEDLDPDTGAAASSTEDITDLLRRWQRGSERAEERLFREIYPQLRRLAASRFSERGAYQSLDVTEVVHEAYLRLVEQRRSEWQNRAHFFAVASRVFRRVIVDHLRAQRSQKRGGGLAWVSIEDAHLIAPHPHVDLLDLDRALQELETFDVEAVRLVEMRYFGGLTIDEAALVLRIGRTSVIGKWRAARAWLRLTLDAGACDG